jgi:hypothetical protein
MDAAVLQQGRGHLGMPEHLDPLLEAGIGSDDQGRIFIKLTDQIEQQGTLCAGKLVSTL